MRYVNAQLRRGMSLMEALIALSIFTIVSLALFNGIHSFYLFNAYTIAQSYQVAEARRGIENMTRDIREMTFADDGSFPLVSMGTSSIGFYSDIDRDDSVELVTYDLVNTTLYKNIFDAVPGTPPTYSTTTPNQTIIISEYVQNNNQVVDVFRYYDENGSIPTNPFVTDIRYIDLQLIINIDPIRDPGEFMLRASAALRNVQENL